VSGKTTQGSTPHGLAFLALLAFVAAFLIARTFTTLYPSTVVMTGGIHFHHFWYGLMMIVGSGWLGIAHNDPRLRRVYAIVFGFGGGLVGDEIGLLLTLGNYHSDLTYFVVVAIVAVGGMAVLFTTSRKELEYDVFAVERNERLAYLGVVIAGAATIPFATGTYVVAAALLAIGIVVVVLSLRWPKGKTKKKQ
jgi:hypothetical protein